jgi:hypothetical protein
MSSLDDKIAAVDEKYRSKIRALRREKWINKPKKNLQLTRFDNSWKSSIIVLLGLLTLVGLWYLGLSQILIQ